MDDDRHSPARRVPVWLSLTAAGLVGLVGWEGYRQVSYTDVAGVDTIGFGSTTHGDGRAVQPGERTDPVRALIRLQADVEAFERQIRTCIGEVPLAAHEWDAYVSLAYNIGPGAFCRSTLVRRLRAAPPDYAGACAEILRWNRAGGRVVQGLKNRRADEHRLCTEGRP